MSKTVSFRCSGELDEFLEREAERRMTTKSAVAQMIVAQYARQVSEDPENGHDPVVPDVVRESASGGANTTDEMVKVEFGSKSRADSVRSNYREYLSEDDDARLKEVRIAEGMPVEVVESIREIRDSE